MFYRLWDAAKRRPTRAVLLVGLMLLLLSVIQLILLAVWHDWQKHSAAEWDAIRIAEIGGLICGALGICLVVVGAVRVAFGRR